MRVIDAGTGRLVRDRQLLLGAKQTASFRLPDGDMTVAKSFAGRCHAPKIDHRTAER